MASPVISCGVLLFSPQQELLLCHATGAAHWDIPKGVGEPGETALDTALRETREETSLQLEPAGLLDLGCMAYRPAKHLHLFATWSARFDPGTCRCTSLFRDPRGRMLPECDAFEWTPFDQLPQRCAASMRKVLTQTLSLPALWQQLRPAGVSG